MRLADAALLVGRLLFGGFFLYNGLNHLLFGTAGLVGYAGAQGVPFPLLAIYLTGFLLLAGGLGIVLGAYPRVALALAALFLAGVTPVMHNFWAFEDPAARSAQLVNFLKNAALLGAALGLMAVPVPWPWSLGPALRRAQPWPGRRATRGRRG